MFDLPRLTRSGLMRHVDYHQSLGSTSDRALALAARDDAPLPLLVLTERQTAGRGRGANRWWSSDGALTFSLVQEAAADVLAADERSQVALVAGLAVCEALEELAPRAEWRVKWPNDVFVNDGKVCGILCESVPGWPGRLVVGIGINVNNAGVGGQESGVRGQGSEAGGQRSVVSGQKPDGQFAPDSRSPNPDSRLPTPNYQLPTPDARPPGALALVDLDGLPRNLTAVLLAVLDRFDLRWTDLVKRGFAALAADYRERCLLTGKTLTVASGGERLFGRCQGIDDRGALVLATENGPRHVLAGTIDRWQL